MPDLSRVGVRGSSRKTIAQRRRSSHRRNRKLIEASSLKYIIILVLERAAVIFAAFLLVSAYGTTISVPEESMEPTLSLGDTVLVDKISLRFRAPKTNDIVVFVPAGNLSAQCSIKRVVGVPGDTILIRGGIVYVNDEPFSEVADVDQTVSAGLAANDIKLDEGEYFLLGDNRNNSEDSRYATIGNISGDDLKGIVWMDISMSHFGLVH